MKHNLSGTPEYKCWQQIKARCLNPKHRAYPNYGGRGITLAPEWKHDFLAFYRHVGPRPTPKHSLDRYPDNDGSYVPGNVRWATWAEQAVNRRPHGTGSRLPPTPRSGKTTNFKHGLVKTPEYAIWGSMKGRCLNPQDSNYPSWGGRGIKVHPEWVTDFTAFLRYIGPRPTPQHSLDRYPDKNGNYEPGNVRWATKQEQTDNRNPCRTGPAHGNYRHGQVKTLEYRAWARIKTRCYNPKHTGYKNYGGQGITMCERWRNDFEAFAGDIGAKPSSGYAFGRENVGGAYSCGLCGECLREKWPRNGGWMTKLEINRNRRVVKLTSRKVSQLRKLAAAGIPLQTLSSKFGVCRSLVGKIVRGENWVSPA